ncbi:MAG: acetolactate synthase [Deltaproteobacteria bacterium]|nr:acetolactate synthase [Deltaproteobacteria bacterium]
MKGAELLVRTATACGIDVCFANAGTTEIPIVIALDVVPGIKAILGLFEGVCTGAADGYGRMLGRPAMALLHLGPGFANGIANLHNARRAQTPIVNVIGEHATWHIPNDPPLAMDVDALTRTVSGWVRRNGSPETVSRDLADAVGASLFGQIASLIVPHDHQLSEAGDKVIGEMYFAYDPVDLSLVEETANRLRTAKKPALLVDGPALRRPGLETLARIQQVIPCDLFAPTFFSCMDRGGNLPDVQRIPYFPETAASLMSGYDLVVNVGSHEPVTFFGYPGVRGQVLSDEQDKMYLCNRWQDDMEALTRLAEALGAPGYAMSPAGGQAIAQALKVPDGGLTPEKACLTIAALQPENSIVVEEGITSTFSYFPLTANVPEHTAMTIAGGSIGYGMPCATGAAVACPDRPVINIQADGSALYTVQALWTQAREGLHVITLICSNRGYRIIDMELERAGISERGQNARALIDIDGPPIDWVRLARGFGVPAASVHTCEALAKELRSALAEPGPHLIEMVLP